jgi:ferredoxin
MKGVLFYHSGSGNTRLACRYIAANLDNVTLDLVDIRKDATPDVSARDLLGFATYTSHWRPAFLMESFIEGLGPCDKLAFVFNTYGFISSRTLPVLEQRVTARGMRVVAGHSLHAPENYPPMVAHGMGQEQAPDEREMHEFDAFVRDLDRIGRLFDEGRPIDRRVAGAGMFGFVPKLPEKASAMDMGPKRVDEALCTQCGTCEKVCPYGAVTLSPGPVWAEEKCFGCWACYNHCPKKAVYTDKYRSVGHTPRPIEAFAKKLSVARKR